MKPRELIFIDLRDKAQVDWLNNIRKKVKIIDTGQDYTVTKTGQVIGKIFDVRCLNPIKRKKIIEKSNSFLGDALTEEIIRF